MVGGTGTTSDRVPAIAAVTQTAPGGNSHETGGNPRVTAIPVVIAIDVAMTAVRTPGGVQEKAKLPQPATETSAPSQRERQNRLFLKALSHPNSTVMYGGN